MRIFQQPEIFGKYTKIISFNCRLEKGFLWCIASYLILVKSIKLTLIHSFLIIFTTTFLPRLLCTYY